MDRVSGSGVRGLSTVLNGRGLLSGSGVEKHTLVSISVRRGSTLLCAQAVQGDVFVFSLAADGRYCLSDLRDTNTDRSSNTGTRGPLMFVH